MVVKTRIVGSSTTITIPSYMNVKPGEKYEPSIDSNGTITFKRVNTLSEEKIKDINEFTQKFKPLMEKLKDK